MSIRGRNDNREIDPAQYTARQVESVLIECNVDIDYDTENDFVCFCPFHGNRNSPSFSVSKTKGKYICFNASCNVTGNLVDLVKSQTGDSEFEARRLIISKKNDEPVSFRDRLQEAFAPAVEFVTIPEETVDRLHTAFWDNPVAFTYMRKRGFSDETLNRFQIGYSEKQRLVVVPMHNDSGEPIGLIGRTPSDEDKRFKNSSKLPTSKTLFNIHRARRKGEVCIITEASFDAMRVDQAGHPNVVSTLSGSVSPYHLEQLDHNFNTIVIMTDFDPKEKHMYNNCGKCSRKGLKLCVGHNPGRDLGTKIATSLPSKRILWASYEQGVVYPDGAKDAGDMTDDQIRQCVGNAVPHFIYCRWGVY